MRTSHNLGLQLIFIVIRFKVLILAASNVRLIIENYLKYGFLMSRPGTFVPPSVSRWNLCL